MKKLPLTLGALVVVVQTTSAQVVVFEQFNYADTAALRANWAGSTAISLNATDGTPSPSASHSGVSGQVARWTGAFSLTPTDTAPVRLSADIFNSGTANQANTVGLRQSGGITPLFEMGAYRLFDNDPNGPIATTDGHGVRTINLGADLAGQDWVRFGPNYTGWAHWEATFSGLSATVNVDYDRDGTFDFSYTETGTTPIGTFGDLRIHSPVASNGGGFSVDNVHLEVVPEPSTYALFACGAFVLYCFSRRRA